MLGHEIGHWKLNHLPKMLLFAQSQLFLMFSMFAAFVKNNSLYTSFGFSTQPVIIGFILFNDVFQPVDAVFQFAMNLLSRKHEYEADEYAKGCGYGPDSVSYTHLDVYKRQVYLWSIRLHFPVGFVVRCVLLAPRFSGIRAIGQKLAIQARALTS